MVYNLVWILSDTGNIAHRLEVDNPSFKNVQRDPRKLIVALKSGRRAEFRVLSAAEFVDATGPCKVQEVPELLLIDLAIDNWKELFDKAAAWREEFPDRMGWKGCRRSPMIDFMDSGPGIVSLENHINSLVAKTKDGHRLRTWEELRSGARLEALLKRAEQRRYRAMVEEDFVLGTSGAMKDAMEKLESFAGSDKAILIAGESGTGKTPLAVAVHQLGKSDRGPFIRVDLTKVPPRSFGKTLFGDARTDGFIQEAAGGTLFLDELGNASMKFQQQLLVPIQDGQYTREGETTQNECKVRFILAMNVGIKELEGMVQRKKFLGDLYHRLMCIEVPPLRDRKQDIPLISKKTLKDLALKYGVVKKLDADALRWLMAQEWPGNVRELRKVLESAHLLAARESVIRVEHLERA